MVWIDCDGYNDGFSRLAGMGFWPEGWIELRADANPLRLDLRCLIGLCVNIMGRDERRVGAVARACADAGARRVIASYDTCEMQAGEPVHTTQRITFSNEELDQWPQ